MLGMPNTMGILGMPNTMGRLGPIFAFLLARYNLKVRVTSLEGKQ